MSAAIQCNRCKCFASAGHMGVGWMFVPSMTLVVPVHGSGGRETWTESELHFCCVACLGLWAQGLVGPLCHRCEQPAKHVDTADPICEACIEKERQP